MTQDILHPAARTARRSRRTLRAAVALVAALSAARSADSQPTLVAESEEERAAAIKAAFVLNFARYATWPSDRFAGPDSPIVARVLGDPLVAEALTHLAARAGEVSGRHLVVATSADRYSDAESPHLVYIGHDTPADDVPALVDELAGAGILTVGDVDDFARRGGMLGLVLEGNRILFDANVAALSESGVGISARVLKLARYVERDRGP